MKKNKHISAYVVIVQWNNNHQSGDIKIKAIQKETNKDYGIEKRLFSNIHKIKVELESKFCII